MRGEKLCQDNCSICHGDVDTAGGLFRRELFPELLLSPALHSQALFDSIVLDGVRSQNGMIGFSDIIPDTADIRACLRERASQTR